MLIVYSAQGDGQWRRHLSNWYSAWYGSREGYKTIAAMISARTDAVLASTSER